jgi:acetyltransferase-like isoleucine patch superfamily enzyme
MKNLARFLVVIIPWCLRRRILTCFWRYDLHPSSRIGLAWVFPEHLSMGAHASIGHLTVCRNVQRIQMGESAIIGRLNYIYGYYGGGITYIADKGRVSELIIGAHSAITNRHLIDCTDAIRIGSFSTIAGYRSQLLTHSIDLKVGRQRARPILIGSYCFLGTNCVVLGGSELPDYSVLGACGLLNKRFDTKYTLYAGVPARPASRLCDESVYFTRTVGFVD